MGFLNKITSAIGGISKTASSILSPISGVASVAGPVLDILGIGSQKDSALQQTRETNAQNYQIWQEQKQHNIDMYNLQKQGNIEMWNMQNAYNTPEAQRQRWESAGFSPYAMLGQNGAIGMATSAPQPASINPSNPPTMIAPPFDISTRNGIEGSIQKAISVIQSLANIKLTGAEVTNKEADTNDKKASSGLKVAQTSHEYSKEAGTLLSNESQEFQNNFNKQVEQFMVESARMEMLNLQSEFVNSMLDAEQKSIVNQYLPAEKELGIMLMTQSYVNSVLEGEKTIQETVLAIAKQIESYATTENIEQDTKNKEKIGEGIDIDNQNKAKQGELLDEEVKQSKITTSNSEQIAGAYVQAEIQRLLLLATDSEQERNLSGMIGYLNKFLKHTGTKVKFGNPFLGEISIGGSR